MVRFALLALLVPALSAIAAPLPAKRLFAFALQSYDAFQISDGVGGNAEAQAKAVFVDVFPADLSTVDATSLANLETMREAAEDAETSLFNPAIDAASGATADALQVGKIKNKVLKLTGLTQVLRIQIAQAKAKGDDTADLEEKLAEEQTKLTKNIATDVKSAGAASLGVAAGSAKAPPAAPAGATTKAAKTKATKATAAAPAATQVQVATSGAGALAGIALRQYADFQISGGVAGNAAAEANAVFVDVLPADLTTVDATSLDNLSRMREAAEDAETSLFNPAIAAASGAAADALQVGKIKNKVLKLTGIVSVTKIKIAQAKAKGADTADLEEKLAEEQTKLTTNIATDVKSAGQKSTPVA